MIMPQNWRYAALWPGSWLYRGIVQLRNYAYDRGLLQTVRVPATVVSVGNLSVGGTGKTPMVALLAQALLQRQLRVAIVARGYHRQGRGTCVVSDGRGTLAALHDAGDEPLLLAQECPQAPLVVDRSKTFAAQWAVQNFHPDILLVDDGFQHRRLQRDCDLVLLPAALAMPPAWLLPAGPLREPWSSLQRAHWIGMTGAAPLPPPLRQRVMQQASNYSTAPLAALQFVVEGLEHLWSRQNLATGRLAGAKVILVSGIAHPQGFHDLVAATGAFIAGAMTFRDHHRYAAKDIAALTQRRHAEGADIIVTTAKDAVKLREWEALKNLPILVLKMRAQLAPEDFAALLALIERAHAQRRS